MNHTDTDRLQQELEAYKTKYVRDHFYSPFPKKDFAEKYADQLEAPPTELPGIELNTEEQIALTQTLDAYNENHPYRKEPIADTYRYTTEGNGCFAPTCAIGLQAMMRHLRPKRIVEVGCGFSSAAILDCNEQYFGNTIDCHFIEPHPERLLSLLKSGDRERITLHHSIVQDVDDTVFRSLAAGDILSIDSSHTVSSGNDLYHLFFRVLPLLTSGVHVHFHDMLYPFEYRDTIIQQQWGWNETYFLRAFLQFNSAYAIAYHPHYVNGLRDRVPEMQLPRAEGGSSFWMRRR